MSRSGGREALVVDPGDQPERIDATLSAAGLRCVAILVTHAHFDHVGAVCALARADGAQVYISDRAWEPLSKLNEQHWPGFGPFEPYEAEHRVADGDVLELAGLTVRVHAAPGHAPGHVVYEIAEGDDVVLCVGDVIFRGSVGRTDFEDGSWPELEQSILRLYERCPLDAPVLSGHTGPTTLRQELRTNPFLDAVRARG